MADLSHDELRRSLRELDGLQREAMPGWRSALQRIFGDNTASVDPAAAREAVTVGGLTRRRMLTVGGFSVATAAVLAACGKDKSANPKVVPVAGEQSKVGSAPERTIDDIVLLRTASSLEYVAIDVYQAALDAGLLTGALASAARLFQGQHREHAALFEQATRDLGGEPFSTRNPVVWDGVVVPALKGGTAAGKEVKAILVDTKGAVTFAHTLENVASATYQSMVSILTQPALRQATMSVGSVEARHAAVLAQVIVESDYIPSSAVVPPSDLEKATAPTTTVPATTTTAAGAEAAPVKVEPISVVPGPFGSVAEALGPNSYMYYDEPDPGATTTSPASTSTTVPTAGAPQAPPGGSSTTRAGTATPTTSNTTRLPSTTVREPSPTNG